MAKCLYVLDTNAILTNPSILESYATKDMIIPDIVLSEIDKLKITAKTDSETRWQGREFTRKLFAMSQGQSLFEGIARPEGGSIRVISLDAKQPMPAGLSAKSPDDKIVACAYQLSLQLEDEQELCLVTSDITMLLKAQALGLKVLRHEDPLNSSFSRRYIIKPFTKYKTPLAILMLAVAVFAATFCVQAYIYTQEKPNFNLPGEYRNFVSEDQASIIEALIQTQNNSKEASALLTLGQAYFELYGSTVKENPASAVTFAKKGTEYFKRALELSPDDIQARCKMGILSLYAGDTDTAITQLTQAISKDPQTIEGNYYLAVVYMQGRRDLDSAEQLFKKVIELAGESADLAPYVQSSQSFIKQIQQERTNSNHTNGDGIVL